MSFQSSTEFNWSQVSRSCIKISFSLAILFGTWLSMQLEKLGVKNIDENGESLKCTIVLTVALELDCGATRFTGSSGNISLPRSPNDHFVTVNCTYTISTDPTNIVFLNHSYTAMARFVQSFQCCEGESLMVRYLHFSLIFVTRKLVAGRGGSVVGFGAFPSGRLQVRIPL